MSLAAASAFLAASEQRQLLRAMAESEAAAAAAKPEGPRVLLPSLGERIGACERCGAEQSCDHRIVPTHKQSAFLELRSGEGLYGGGKGSGKTRALVMAPLYWVSDGRFRALLLRREWPEAKRTLLEESKKVYPKLGAEWIAGRKVWRFPSGAEIEINGCEHGSDVERYYGTPELSFLGIDQLEHFTRDMYLALISCVRSSAGLPLLIRASANPGGIGQAWLVDRFGPWVQPVPGAPWHDPQYRGPFARSGEVLWYRTTAGEEGRDTVCEPDAFEPDCAEERRRLSAPGPVCEPGKPCALHRPRSRTYVHAVLSDNPFTAGTTYETNLLSLDPVQRAQFLGGNWMISAKPGDYFSRTYMPAITVVPAHVFCRVRYWDRAGTEQSRAKSGTAWTAGVRLALLVSGLIVVEDVVRGQWDPGRVDAEIVETADRDPPGTLLAIEKDGGQAGIAQAYYDSRMLAGRDFTQPPPFKDKVSRMRPWSAQCRAGNVAIIKAPWNEAYWREHEGCPGSIWDQIDSSAGGLIQLLQLQEQLVAMQAELEHRAAAARAHRPGAPRSIDGGSTRLRW